MGTDWRMKGSRLLPTLSFWRTKSILSPTAATRATTPGLGLAGASSGRAFWAQAGRPRQAVTAAMTVTVLTNFIGLFPPGAGAYQGAGRPFFGHGAGQTSGLALARRA